MTAPIEFQPNLARRRGGVMVLNQPLSGQEIVDLYHEWLVREHPEMKGELAFDAPNKVLYVGYWDVQVLR
jgi:hypothetical protein